MVATQLYSCFLIMILAFCLTDCVKKDEKKEASPYEIEAPVYVTLAEKAMDFYAGFEYDSFGDMLAENIEYDLPNGHKIFGKKPILDFLKEYRTSSGLEKMKIKEANYLPIHNYFNSRGDEIAGVKVLADFKNEMSFKNSLIEVRMNFNLHFNDKKLIDRILTIYDQTEINKASNKP